MVFVEFYVFFSGGLGVVEGIWKGGITMYKPRRGSLDTELKGDEVADRAGNLRMAAHAVTGWRWHRTLELLKFVEQHPKIVERLWSQ